MKGGVKFYKGSGREARAYVEADHHTPRRADEYYLAEGHGIAPMTRISAADGVVERRMLDGDTYEKWVEGFDVRTGEAKGRVRAGTDDRKALRFAEININCPKSLSIVAAIHPEISRALDGAQDAAADELNRVLARSVTTRVGPKGQQRQLHVDEIEVVSVAHQTSRAGDPHRHIHHQVNARVVAGGKYRGLDSVAMLGMTRMLNGVGERAILAHPELRQALAAHGYSLTRDGEVEQLVPYVPAMSKRGQQVERNLARYEREWRKANANAEPSRETRVAWQQRAWADGRQAKNKARLAMAGELVDQEWRQELSTLGVDIAGLQAQQPVEVSGPRPGEVDREEVAARALAVLGAGANGRSAWNVFDVRGAVEETLAKRLVHGDAQALSELAEDCAARVRQQCLSTDPTRRALALPEHIRHLTSQAVIEMEQDIAGRLAGRATEGHADYELALPAAERLDTGQQAAVRALAGTGQLVMIEGAAGTGKTSMLRAASGLVPLRVLAPSRKAAMLAAAEIGEVEANTVHGLVYAHGYRWDAEGVWTRLQVGDVDPVTGRAYRGPGPDSRLVAGHLLVVDEAGMLDQECARAVLTVADESRARLAFVGDRQQLPAIGRGGVMDMVAGWAPAQVEMSAVHRFRQRVEVSPGGPLADVPDAEYAELSLGMRAGIDPGETFDALHAGARVQLHETEADALAAVAMEAAEAAAGDGRGSLAVAVSTNEAAEEINLAVRRELVSRGLVDDQVTAMGADGIPVGRGDLVQTRANDRNLGVMNREVWRVQSVRETDGTLRLRSELNRSRFAEVPAKYCRDSVQHAWAQTIHGAQGATADRGLLLLSDSTTASAAYVGMTRGKYSNQVHIVAAGADAADARQQWVEAAGRGRPDLGLVDAAAAAKVAAGDYAQELPRERQPSPHERLADVIAQMRGRVVEPRRPLDQLTQEELTYRLSIFQRQQGLQERELHTAREHPAGGAVAAAQAALDERMARAVEAQQRQERVRELQGQVASAGRGMSNSQTALAGCGRFQGGRKRELTAEIEQHRVAMDAAQNQLQQIQAVTPGPGPQGERPGMVAAEAPRLLAEAAATDARLAAAPERLELALLETREQLAQAQAELELRERRPELVPVPVPAPRPVEPQRTRSEAYADYRAPEPERGYSRGFGR